MDLLHFIAGFLRVFRKDMCECKTQRQWNSKLARPQREPQSIESLTQLLVQEESDNSINSSTQETRSAKEIRVRAMRDTFRSITKIYLDLQYRESNRGEEGEKGVCCSLRILYVKILQEYLIYQVLNNREKSQVPPWRCIWRGNRTWTFYRICHVNIKGFETTLIFLL